MSSTENNTNNKNEKIRKEFESQTIIDTDEVDIKVVNNDDTHPDADDYRQQIYLLNKSYEFLPIWAFATALLLFGLTYFTYLKLVPLFIAAPLFVGLFLIIVSTMQFRRNMNHD